MVFHIAIVEYRNYSQYLHLGVSGSVFGEFRTQFLVQLKLCKLFLMKYKQ